jgi:uncharacterized protein involved in type VI secretion and phage assembly
MKPPIGNPSAAARHFYGKYRGTVANDLDPQQLGRLQLQVPAVPGTTVSAWALPCAPIAGPQMGIFALPPVGAAVWVEFEAGNPDQPIWVGGFWNNAAEMPAIGHGTGTGIVLQDGQGARIVLNKSGITIENGRGATIVLAGPEVSVNGGALAVT